MAGSRQRLPVPGVTVRPIVTLDNPLTEGTYNIDVAHAENGGSAGMQFLAALGDVIAGEVASSGGVLLTTSTAVNLPRNIGLSLAQEVERLRGGFNGDGLADTSDVVTALGGSGYELGPKAAVSAVPEPTSLVLLLMGTLATCVAPHADAFRS